MITERHLFVFLFFLRGFGSSEVVRRATALLALFFFLGGGAGLPKHPPTTKKNIFPENNDFSSVSMSPPLSIFVCLSRSLSLSRYHYLYLAFFLLSLLLGFERGVQEGGPLRPPSPPRRMSGIHTLTFIRVKCQGTQRRSLVYSLPSPS